MLSAALVRSVLDSAPDAMIVIDAHGSVLFANHQVNALFGLDPEEVLGRSVESLLPERFRERHVNHRSRYAQAGHARPMGIGLELFALRKDGTEFPVEISLSPVRDGEKLLIAAAIRDVTGRMKVEGELQEAHSEADRANQAKGRFLATASHDLRQPLQSLGLLNGALRRLVTDDDALDALLLQEQAIFAMTGLLNALLDISKLESGAVRPDIVDFDVAALLEGLRREFSGIAGSKGLQFTIDTGTAAARSDPSLVGQILRNLISNAIKYTTRGEVRLACHLERDAVRIEVHDTGIGIPADKLDHIYDEFYQVGIAANSSRDGYGLGLAIVRRLVRLLQLRIDVRSEAGIGSVFSLAVPLGSPTEVTVLTHARGTLCAVTRPDVQHHVLLVEDDVGVRNATRVFLKVEGYRVTATASLDEAMQRVTAAPDVDMIVTDYHLGGGVTGTEVISTIRQVLGADTPAILVTGDTSSAIHELQRDAYLRIASKPTNADELVALIRELLSS